MTGSPQRAADLVGNRQELKFQLSMGQARALVARVREHLAPHRYEGPGGTSLPGARHFITSVYFDTPDQRVLAEARGGRDGTRIRARVYYDEFPALATHARRREDLYRQGPEIWLEVKRTRGGRSAKWRLSIPKRSVPDLLAGRLSLERLDQLPLDGDVSRQEAGAHLRETAERYGGQLHANVIVNYRRTAWQDSAGTLRITADQDLAFFAVPERMWERDLVLERSFLGQAIGEVPGCLLEIKSTAGLPRWLESELDALELRPRAFSKFVAAGTALILS